MKRFEKIIDILGKALLLWFFFESVRFFYSGRFLELAGQVPQYFQQWSLLQILLGLHIIFHMVISAFGVLAVIPLLLRGHAAGLVLGIVYCLEGNTISPLSFIIPDSLLITRDLKPSVLAISIDVLWTLIALTIVVLFFLQRRATSD